MKNKILRTDRLLAAFVALLALFAAAQANAQSESTNTNEVTYLQPLWADPFSSVSGGTTSDSGTTSGDGSTATSSTADSGSTAGGSASFGGGEEVGFTATSSSADGGVTSDGGAGGTLTTMSFGGQPLGAAPGDFQVLTSLSSSNYSQNFDSLGTSGTATLPTGWFVTNSTSAFTGTNATTLAYGTTGTGVVTGTSAGGYINWGNGTNASATDRALGILNTGSFTSPRVIIFNFTNSLAATVTNLSLSWDYEKYRSGTRQFDWTFAYSTDGTTWTTNASGAQTYAADANNTTISNPPSTISKALDLAVTILNNAAAYLKWTLTGLAGSSNAQGLAIDNFSMTAFTQAVVAALNWTGGSGNWDNGFGATVTNGSALSFSGAGGIATNNLVSPLIASMTFSNGAGSYTVAGNAFTISNGIVNNSANAQTFSNAITLGAAQTFDAAAGDMTFAGAVDNATFRLTVGGTSNTVVSGAITGTGGLTKSGTGTLTLSGANGYTGGTLVSAGRLIGDTTSLQGAITNNAAVTFSQTTNGTYASNMAGSGSLAKAGSATVTFSGTVAAGTVAVAEGAFTAASAGRFTGTPTVTVSNGAAINLVGNETFGSLAGAGSVSNTTGTLVISGNAVSTTFSGVLSGAGNLAKAGTGTLILSGANNYSGSTTISNGVLRAGANNVLPATAVTVGTSGGTALTILDLNGTSQTIGSLTLLGNNSALTNRVDIGSGGQLTLGGDVQYETADGVDYPVAITGGTLNLGGATRTFLVNSNQNTTGDLQISSVVANGGINKTGNGLLALSGANTMSGTVTVSAGTLILSNANALQNATLDTGSSGTQAVTFVVAGNNTYNVGALAGGDALAIGGNTLSVGANNSSTTYSGIISGTGGGLTKVGTGTMTLSGANSFTGPVSISAGAVRATVSGALGGTATNTTVSSGGALELSGGFSLNAEPITISGTGIGDGGAIRNVSGDNTNTGVVTLAANSRINSDAGTLQVNVSGVDANGITGSFNLSLGGSGNFDFRDRIAIGTGALTKDGAGILTLISAASHSGGTTLSAGTIQLGATESNALGTGTITLNGGILSGNNTVARTLTNNVTIGGNMTFGDGSSTAAITLSGPVSLGAVNRTLTIQNANTAFSGQVSGSGASITKAGSGTLTLSGSNSFTGGTTVNGGILRLANTGAAGSGSITQLDGTSQIEIDVAGTITNDMNAYVIDFLQNAVLSGAITMNGTVIDAGSGISATNSGVLSGSGGMTKTGLGTLTLSAANTYSGATTVSGGRLVVDGSQSSSAVTVNSGATLAGIGTVGGLTVSGTLAPGNSIGTLSAGSTVFDTNGFFDLEISDFAGAAGTAWDLLAITGDLTLSNTSVNPFTINLLSMTNSTTPGFAAFNPNLSYTNTFVTFTGSLLGTTFNTNLFTISTAGFSNSITLNGAFSITNVSGGLALLYSTFFVPASDYTWTAGSGLWSDTNSWTNNIEPGDNGAVIFAGAGGNSTNDLVTSTASLVFSNTAGSYTLSGNAITNGVLGVVNNSSNAQTINNDIILGGAQTFDATAGNLTFGGAIDNGGFLLGVAGASNVVINGVISNTGGITKTGTGSLTLGGNNTFSGALAANEGTVFVTGTQATTTLNVGGGTLLLGANSVLADGATLALSSGSVDFGGFSDTITTFNLSGGVFTNGTLTASTYGLSGGTVGGTLGAGTANVTGAVSLSGVLNSTLNVNSGGTLTLASNDRIGDSSAVTVSAGTLATATFNDTVGSLVLNSSGSITGTGTITAGTYTLNGGTVGANLGTGTATASTGTTLLNGTLGADLTVSGGTVNLGSADRISDAAAVSISSGTLGMGANNDTVSAFGITGGTLGGTGTLTAATYTLGGGTLTANLGAGAATSSVGTTSLNGTLGADLTVSGGTVNLGSANRISDSAAVSISSGTLGMGANNDTISSFTISGGTLGGTGTLTASTYSLQGGTVTANLGAGTATVTNGTTALNGTLAATTLNVNGGTLNLGSAGRLADTAAVTIAGGTLGMGTVNDTVGSFAMTSGTLGGTTGVLTASTYALQGGTISANLGAGTATVTSGSTALNGTLAATTVNVDSGELNLGASDRLANTAAVTVSGGTLGMSNFTDTIGAFTISGGTLGGTGTLTAGSYALQGGTVAANLGTGTATASTGTTTINGNLGGALTASGGTANLNGTVAGNVTVSGGTVNLGSADRIGGSSAVNVSSGALNLNGNDSVGAVTLSGGSIGGSGTLTGLSYAVQGGTISAAIGGSGAMTKTGATTTTLSANNSGFSGAVAINEGILLATTSGALGSGAVTVTNGSTLAASGVTLANNFTIGTAASVTPGTSAFIAGWDFQTTTNGGTASATADAVQPRVFVANFGIGTLYLDGSQGSSSWVSTNTTAREINSFGGTTVNASNGLSTVTTTPAGLALVNSSANGKSAVFKFSLTGYTNLAVTLAAQRGNTGFDNQLWEFSTNGTTYTTIGNLVGGTTAGTIRDSFANTGVIGFSDITGLNNATEAYIRVTFTGATATTGNNRLDNIQLNAFSLGITNAASGSGIIGLNEAGSAAFTGNITNNNVAAFTAANGGLATFSGIVSGLGSVTKTGTGTVTLSGNNTYSGGTTLSNGVLRLTSATGAGSGTITQSNGTTLEIDTTGTVANAMSLFNVRTLQTVTLSGNKTLNNATYTVDSGTTTTESGTLSGTGGITKEGTGSLVVTASNSFTGATVVNAGVLNLNSSTGSALGGSTSVTVTNGATLLLSTSGNVANAAAVTLSGGTITRGSGVSEVFGNLNITTGSFLDFGTGTEGNLTFGTYQNNETPSALLTLNNFIPGNSFTFSSTSFTTNSMGSYFTFGTGFVDYSVSNTGSTFTITAIPEPSTYLAAAGLLSLMLWPSRKRIVRDAKKILGLTPPMRDRLAARSKS